jgi:acetyl-CoA/propionyl-CoA carboxylase biotin carboxyl carrier protein
MLRALEEFVIEGPTTLLGFHRALLESACFVEGGTCRGVVESEELARRAQELDQLSHQRTSVGTSADGRPAGVSTRDHVVAVEIDGRRHEVRLQAAEPPWAELARRHRERSRGLVSEATGAVTSPMQGTVLSVAVSDGDAVSTGDLICVVEAMKMENEIVSHADGVVAELAVAAGEPVSNGQVICVIASA